MKPMLIAVKFNSTGQPYHYECPDSIDRPPPKVGHFVIVDTPWSGYKCVEITQLDVERESDRQYKRIVDIVDDTEYLRSQGIGPDPDLDDEDFDPDEEDPYE